MTDMILAGDIGGTNTRLAVFAITRGRLLMRERSDFRNAGREGLAPIVREFLAPLKLKIKLACFGVAGPVKDGRAKLTNLEWSFDERKLPKSLKIPRVALINDLVAHAEGINELRPKDLVTLQRGVAVKHGNRAIIAPGTGLGEAGLVFDPRSNDYRAYASEGGHSDFAPTDDRQIALMSFIRARTGGRCSWEDVLSGPGLKHVYEFIALPGRFHVESTYPGADARPAEISEAAMKSECKAAIASTELLATLYGAEAGNLALKTLATGGVYIGGGIANYILKFLKHARVREAFTRKGPPSIQQLLSRMPIHVITSDGALLGAAHYAQRLLTEVRVKR